VCGSNGAHTHTDSYLCLARTTSAHASHCSAVQFRIYKLVPARRVYRAKAARHRVAHYAICQCITARPFAYAVISLRFFLYLDQCTRYESPSLHNIRVWSSETNSWRRRMHSELDPPPAPSHHQNYTVVSMAITCSVKDQWIILRSGHVKLKNSNWVWRYLNNRAGFGSSFPSRSDSTFGQHQHPVCGVILWGGLSS